MPVRRKGRMPLVRRLRKAPRLQCLVRWRRWLPRDGGGSGGGRRGGGRWWYSVERAGATMVVPVGMRPATAAETALSIARAPRALIS